MKSSQYLHKAFGETLQSCGLSDIDAQISGIPQLRSILIGASRAGLSLDILRAGWVSWKFFGADGTELAEMRDAMMCLRSFEIHILTLSVDYAEESADLTQCRQYLADSRFWCLIKDTPLLENLTVIFESNEPVFPAELGWIVGDTRWKNLTTVNFDCISSDERSWVAFFCRHQQTLRGLCLRCVRLTTGGWPSVLESMHKSLNLTTAHFQGRLLGDEPQQCWDLYDEMTCQISHTGKAIEDYLTGGKGNCPLLDENAHPQTW